MSIDLPLNADKFEIISELEGFSNDNYHIYENDGSSILNISYNSISGFIPAKNSLFEVRIKEELIDFEPRLKEEFRNEIYDSDLIVRNVEIVKGNNIFKGPHLNQNRPNPFSTNTEVSFYIPKEDDVRFTILNIKGEEIRVIKNKYDAGDHALNLNLQDLPHGVYYLRMLTRDYISTIKMIIIE